MARPSGTSRSPAKPTTSTAGQPSTRPATSGSPAGPTRPTSQSPPDARDSDLTGFREAFVTKISGDDGSILYSSFLGGDYSDGGNDIAIGPDGNLYLTGYTRSIDFPVVNPIQEEIAGYPYGATDAFVTVMSPDGQTLLYSTYFGGFAVDKATSIAVDLDGNIFIHGETRSDDWPVANALQASHAGGETDTFLVRLSADGQTLDFSTYLGGEDEDRPGRIALDGLGNVYVTGATRSVAFPTTAGSYQPNFAGAINGCEVPFGADYNCEDVFISKISGDGSTMLYGTYLGGSRPDEARAIAVDAAGSARIVGYTYSSDFPGGIDGAAGLFVARLNEEGSDLDFVFTTFSGSANQGHGAAVGPDGSTYFTGAIDVPANVYVGKLSDGVAGPDGDIDGDGDVDQADLGALLGAYGSCDGDANWNQGADLNSDNCIGQDDLGILLGNYGA